jgi:hypothetical protein
MEKPPSIAEMLDLAQALEIQLVGRFKAFAPISFRTCSAGKPLGWAIAGAFRPAGMWPNPTTTKGQHAMRHGCLRRERFAAGYDLLVAFDRSGIGQV